jgi:hypothetical protein
MNKNLIFFYGDGCSHCEAMESVCVKLESDTGVSFERVEVYNNPENEEKLKSLDDGSCGGVPFFANTNTGKNLCGEVTYEELKDLSMGE